MAGAYVSRLPASAIAAFAFRRLPELTLHVFYLADGQANPKGTSRGQLVVRGPLSRLSVIAQPDRDVEFIGVELRAGAGRDVLGERLGEVPDRALPLDLFWGDAAGDLLQRMDRTDCREERLALIEAAVAARLTAQPSVTSLTRMAADRLFEARGDLTVAQLAEEFGLSERQLHRRFVDDIGFPPKLCARIARFRCLVQRLADGVSPAAAAAEFGYADQAHLSSEFRSFTGQSPVRFFAEEDFVEAFVSLGWLVTPRV